MAKKRKKQNRKQNQHQDDSRGRAASYENVIAEGRQLAEAWQEDRGRLNERQRLIFDYYSRLDIQRAMFQYAKGRKITVLRTFRALYNQIESPKDILYIALYHAEQKGMWPSLHGMISRYVEERVGHVCDFVIEIDYKKSWKTSFQATLPYIEALRDFGIYACVKFSGNVSAHVIIPGETFPDPTDAGNIRKQFNAPGNVREKLMDYVQKIVKHPDRLDRYFLQSTHFLRLPYSLNERTGRVSVPIEMDAFEQFSWRDAEARRVQVLDDWWRPPPEDAPDRMREFLDFTSRRYHIMLKEEVAERREQARKRAEREARKRGVGRKPAPTGEKPPVAVSHAAQPLADAEDYQQMLTTAQEEWLWCESFLERDGLKESLSKLRTTEGVISLHDLGSQHGCSLNELWRVWHWLHHLPALEHYAKSEVQQRIFQACQSRRLRLWGEETPFQLQRPEDVYPLAVFHHKLLGTHEYPAFLMSIAEYEPKLRFPHRYDLVIAADGVGQETVAAEVAAELGKGLLSQGLTSTAYHAGTPHVHLWVQTPIGDEVFADETPQQYADIVEGIRKFMRNTQFAQTHWRTLKRDEFVPVPHSLNLYTGMPCLSISTPSEGSKPSEG